MKVGDLLKGLGLALVFFLHFVVLKGWNANLGIFFTLLNILAIFFGGGMVVYIFKYYLENSEVGTLIETKLFQQGVIGYAALVLILFIFS